MKFLRETYVYPLQVLKEAIAGKSPRLYIEGVFLQANKVNRNGRDYPKPILEGAVGKYNLEHVKTGRAVGELGHPDGPQINLDKVSHRITELRWEKDDVIGKALIVDTPMGNIVRGLLDGGVQLGVSSRGLGSLERSQGVMRVKEDFLLSCVDIVQDPSAPDAFVSAINESIDYFIQDGKICAKKVDQLLESHKKLKLRVPAKIFEQAQLQAFQKLFLG